MAETDKLLEVRNLRTTFDVEGTLVYAVRGISLSLAQGEVLGVVGESGSGKSVSMKSIIRLLPPTAAIQADCIRFDGTDMATLGEKALRDVRGDRISMIFQDPMTSLDPLRTVGSHIAEVLRRHRGLKRDEARSETVRLLREVGVEAPERRAQQYPHEFSGGMRQRVLIAMALACQPKLLIADEPTTALDVTIQAQILNLIADLQRREGMSVILITHNLGIVAQMCSRICVMYAGLIMEEGSVEDIFYRPAHPYTRALLASIPSESGDGGRLVPIAGQAPSLIAPPPGCPFAPRCGEAAPACEGIRCELIEVAQGHRTACFRYAKEVNADE